VGSGGGESRKRSRSWPLITGMTCFFHVRKLLSFNLMGMGRFRECTESKDVTVLKLVVVRFARIGLVDELGSGLVAMDGDFLNLEKKMA
jgi:hypothetical protein